MRTPAASAPALPTTACCISRQACPTIRPAIITRPRRRSSSRGKIIVGGAVNDNFSTQEQSGVIRAFDVNTGALVWNWDSRQSGPDDAAAARPDLHGQLAEQLVGVPASTRRSAWSMCRSATRRRTSSAWTAASNVEKFSSSIVALDLATGQVRWVRQTVHHDLWDMDVPAQPALLDLTTADGTPVPALVGPTKQGDIYVLDRRTGEPIMPVKEDARARRRDPGGFHRRRRSRSPASPSCPIRLTEKDMWGVTHVRPARLPHRLPPAATTRAATRRRRCKARSSIPAISACSTGAASRSIRSGR